MNKRFLIIFFVLIAMALSGCAGINVRDRLSGQDQALTGAGDQDDHWRDDDDGDDQDYQGRDDDHDDNDDVRDDNDNDNDNYDDDDHDHDHNNDYDRDDHDDRDDDHDDGNDKQDHDKSEYPKYDTDIVNADYGDAFTARDLVGSYSTFGASYIELSGNAINITGYGAVYDGSAVRISKEGVYILSGSFSGQIYIDTDSTDKVQLVLNNVSIECADNAALYIKEADKVFITLPEGTENTLSDGEVYSVRNNDDKTDAALFSRADIVINGSGSLFVEGKYKHGIVSKDDVKITGGDIRIKAKNSGIVGKDSVRIANGNITVVAGSDGIKSDNDTNNLKGYVSIYGGRFFINAGKDCIQAETGLSLYGGSFELSAGEYVFHFAADDVDIDNAVVIGSGKQLCALAIDCACPYIEAELDSYISSDTDVYIKDREGNIVLSSSLRGGSRLVFAASPKLSRRSEYMIVIGDISFSAVAS